MALCIEAGFRNGTITRHIIPPISVLSFSSLFMLDINTFGINSSAAREQRSCFWDSPLPQLRGQKPQSEAFQTKMLTCLSVVGKASRFSSHENYSQWQESSNTLNLSNGERWLPFGFRLIWVYGNCATLYPAANEAQSSHVTQIPH